MGDTPTSRKPFERQKRSYIRLLRYLIQWTIVIIVIIGGVSLHTFFTYIRNGTVPPFEKPLSVEGFMPIGALMALKLWIAEGIFDPTHPAALVVFISSLFPAVFLKKGFCGWICPVGAISEPVWKLGRNFFGKNYSLPKYADYALMSVKYLAAAFFLYIILLKMSPTSIRTFLFTPYWKAADFKLLVFFIDMSTTTLVVLAALFVFSLLIKNFWCRYLCPYGALLGLLSIISPFKVTRNEEKCIHCRECTRSCPAYLPVEEKERVSSPECVGCLTCVGNCPSKGALDIALPYKRWVRPFVYIALIITVFWGSIVIARAVGYWKSNVTVQEYQTILPHIEKLRHP